MLRLVWSAEAIIVDNYHWTTQARREEAEHVAAHRIAPAMTATDLLGPRVVEHQFCSPCAGLPLPL